MDTTKTNKEPVFKENVILLESLNKPLMENVSALMHTLETDVNFVRIIISET